MLPKNLLVTTCLLALGYCQDLYTSTTGTSSSSSSGSTSVSSTTEALASTAPPPPPTEDWAALGVVGAERALAWLATQRDSSDYGYRNDTAVVIVAQQVARSLGVGVGVTSDADLRLTGKQLEVELVVTLWRHSTLPPAPGRLAMACLALAALCRDPRQFHGHDLVGALLHHEDSEPPVDLHFAYAALAACSARAHIRKRQIRRLLEIANAPHHHNIDTVAVTVMTLKCIVRDHRHRTQWLHAIRKPSLGLARQQQDDGGFGNVYNTALALQALHDIAELSAHWKRGAALRWLEGRQDPDGAFTDPALTATATLALLGRGLDAVRQLPTCTQPQAHAHDTHPADPDLPDHVHPPLSPLSNLDGHNQTGDTVTVTYTLWVGANVSQQNTIAVAAQRNASFYSVMQTAADLEPAHFAFEASHWPNGHYVHTIAGHREEPMGYHYWLLYRLPERPDVGRPPANHLVAPVGVDDLLVDDGDHFLFWYKKL